MGWIVSPKRIKDRYSVHDYDLIWKLSLCRYNQVKMKSYTIRVGPSQMTDVLIKWRKFWHRHRENTMWRHTDKQERTPYEDTETEIRVRMP